MHAYPPVLRAAACLFILLSFLLLSVVFLLFFSIHAHSHPHRTYARIAAFSTSRQLSLQADEPHTSHALLIMKVPFFRSKTAKAAGSSETKGQRRSGLGMLEGITSESELSSYSNTPAHTPLSPRTTNASVAALPKLRTAPANSAHKGGSTAAGAIAGQLAEMEGFLDTITGFQNEARRLFPENMALDQILTDLQDECQRRVMYMTRVSAPPAWMASHQRQSSSSSTIGATTAITAPGNLSSGGRHSTVALGQQSPVSTTTMTSNNSSSSSTDSGSRSRGDSAATSSDGGDGDKNNKGSSRNYFSRHSHNHNNSNSSTKKAPAGGGGSPPTPRIPSSFNTVPLSASSRAGNSPLKRDPRTADSRRKAAAQSMFVSSPVST
ncbi:hypothetical protein GQ54DRAFT_121853 [Martensiomyces pterosporus]|nr:hypothetical protein GQ54DRAFT_121853 [Martensiomyces pterosporus]